MTEEKFVLVTMRLVDMTRLHPAQDNSHVCSRCGERVGVYPSGMKSLKEHPEGVVICVSCALAAQEPGDINVPAASWPEIAQEERDSVDVPKA